MDSASSEVSTDSLDALISGSNAHATPTASGLKATSMDTRPGLHSSSDSDTDISMSADSEDDGNEIYQPSPPIKDKSLVQTINSTNISKKRRYPESSGSSSNGYRTIERSTVTRKRPRPDDDSDLESNGQSTWKRPLPAEIWHRIFTFCRPKDLGRLLRVSKSFNAHLDPSSNPSLVAPPTNHVTSFLKPDAIWRASRRLFCPGMPSPLRAQSEIAMWRLVFSVSCQFCGTKGVAQPTGANQPDQWHPGPGENGVNPVWSFALRTCGPCLQSHTLKEIDLLLSSVPSPLMAALPFIFFSNELHVLSSTTLQTGPPPGIQFTKVFLNSHVDDIRNEFLEVQTLGPATVEEWLKGLDERGADRRNDGLRWERWEASGGLNRIRIMDPYPPQKGTTLANDNNTNVDQSAPKMAPTTIPPKPESAQNITQLPKKVHPLPLPVHASYSAGQPPRFDSPLLSGFPAYPRSQPLLGKHERTKDEADKLKAARRVEIERRCMSLSPPIPANILTHMPSFQASIHIIQPFDDAAWDVLKPRILAQRGEAEKKEFERLAQDRVKQEASSFPDSKDVTDMEWDDAQGPLRARIGGYADNIVRDRWDSGEKVSKESCAKFAADVLLYVRRKFYADVIKDDIAARAAGHEPELDPPNGPFTRKLILENMKWVFDNKIKPHTEKYSKELFLCNACENNSKFYGFEGVIQHFAAKHTRALSLGTVVVHWKSEWPESPPFNPDPSHPRNPYMAIPTGIQYASAPILRDYAYGGYQLPPTPAPLQLSNPHIYQESPGPYYGHPQFGDQHSGHDQYSGHRNGPFAPPPSFPDPNQAYQPQQYPAAPNHNGAVYGEASLDYTSHSTFSDNTQGYSIPPYPATNPNALAQAYGEPDPSYGQPNYNGPYLLPAQNVYPAHSGTIPVTHPEGGIQQQPYGPQTIQYAQAYYPAAPPSGHPPQAPEKSEEYKAQLQTVAKTARDIWNSISTVKDIPGSVKVHTIIYHVLKNFRERYQEKLSLTVLIDGLSNNKDMRPVRNVNGLVCKACSLGLPGALPGPDKKHYSFPQLVNHFHSAHEIGVQNAGGHVPEWIVNIVELPDQARLSSIPQAPGMDDHRLKIFAEALPEIVAQPLPKLEDLQRREDTRYRRRPVDHASDSYLVPSYDRHERFYAAPSPSVDRQYDPRDPHGPYEPEHRTETPPQYMSKQHIRDPRHNYDRDPLDDVDRSPAPLRYSDGLGHKVLHEDERPYQATRGRYRTAEDAYQARREAQMLSYDDRESIPPRQNVKTYYPAGEMSTGSVIHEKPLAPANSRSQPIENTTAQKNRINDVVAQISHQAQQAKAKLDHAKHETIEGGSEDGELRGDSNPQHEDKNIRPSDESKSLADRFLDQLSATEAPEGAPRRVEGAEYRREDKPMERWEVGRTEGSSMAHPSEVELRHVREPFQGAFQDEPRRGLYPIRSAYANEEDITRAGYIMHERPPPSRQARSYTYEEQYLPNSLEQPVTRETREAREPREPRERSPEFIDRRYVVNNVVYQDERPNSRGPRRTPSRYARYESVRLEAERARSRSPVYVKVGSQPGNYRERSPGASVPTEPVYRARSPPPPANEAPYSRASQSGYYRVYADDVRPRQPQYAEAYELVKVSDPQGDYMIRRPVRREPEPIYSTYENDSYARQPAYESRPPVSRADPAYYEEYDPRHPEPPPTAAPARQVRYH